MVPGTQEQMAQQGPHIAVIAALYKPRLAAAARQLSYSSPKPMFESRLLRFLMARKRPMIPNFGNYLFNMIATW